MFVWRRHLKPGDLFIDVGANIGIFTVFALDLGAEVIACEPDPHNYGRLRENVALNDYHADLLNVAVADYPGTLRLTQGLDSYNHLILDGDTGIEVEAVTLDSIIGDRRVAGVKIDVEGAERLVIEGARRALHEERVELIQLEWSADQVTNTLGERRDRVAELLDETGYLIHRPDDFGVLHRLVSSGEGRRDVFAAPRAVT